MHPLSERQDRPSRLALTQRGLALEYATLGWNLVGCWIVLGAAYAAHSVALGGFGIDSVIEIFASVIVVWQLKAINKDKEHLAERLTGIAFLLLAVYITVQSAIVLLTRFHPRTSLLGIIWLALTCVAMMLLAYGKSRIGRALGNPVLQKESKVTVVDGVLAGSVLIGIALNAIFGLWWADPLAAFVIVYYGFKEGYTAVRGKATNSV
jgi:divalent metal cation (Fe/Co/Zn/Cd) transporter